MQQGIVRANALAHSLRVAPVLFLAAMVDADSAPFALPVLALGVAWSGWRGELDLAARFDALEWGGIAFIAVWLAALAAGIDAPTSLRLSIPLLAASICVFVLRRHREHAAAVAAFDLALFLLATWQCMRVTATLLGGSSGEDAVRAAGTLWLVEPNDIAWMACAWPPLLAWRLTRGSRALIALPIALALLLMVVLGSRLGLLAALAALVPMLARTPRRVLGLASALATVLALAALRLDPAIFGKGTASIASRLQLWGAATKLFFDFPWLGAGPFGFPLGYVRYLPEPVAIDPRATPWPHSLPLEIAAGMGLAGIAAAVTLVVAVALQYRRLPAASEDVRRVIVVQCVVFAMLALTEWYAYHPAVKQKIGLKPGERMAGFIYIGTAEDALEERLRPDMGQIVTRF